MDGEASGRHCGHRYGGVEVDMATEWGPIGLDSLDGKVDGETLQLNSSIPEYSAFYALSEGECELWCGKGEVKSDCATIKIEKTEAFVRITCSDTESQMLLCASDRLDEPEHHMMGVPVIKDGQVTGVKGYGKIARNIVTPTFNEKCPCPVGISCSCIGKSSELRICGHFNEEGVMDGQVHINESEYDFVGNMSNGEWKGAGLLISSDSNERWEGVVQDGIFTGTYTYKHPWDDKDLFCLGTIHFNSIRALVLKGFTMQGEAITVRKKMYQATNQATNFPAVVVYCQGSFQPRSHRSFMALNGNNAIVYNSQQEMYITGSFYDGCILLSAKVESAALQNDRKENDRKEQKFNSTPSNDEYDDGIPMTYAQVGLEDIRKFYLRSDLNGYSGQFQISLPQGGIWKGFRDINGLALKRSLLRYPH